MGQKVNALSLRQSNNKKWNSKSFVDCKNYSEILHELINLYHVYCPDELIYTPDELLLLEDFSKVGETTKPEETTIVKNVSKDVILFSDFEDETLKTKLLGLGAKFRKSISKKVTVIVFDDNKMNLKKTKTKIANAQNMILQYLIEQILILI